MMKILLIEPYYGGSHKIWADNLKRNLSAHDVQLLTLPAQFWKWRMQGGAVTLARQFNALEIQPDLILVTDMMNVATFQALTQTQIPIALYFHESQLTYPQNSRQRHGWRYGFVNYISALTADAVFFNSQYHFDVFFEWLPRMLKHFADYNELETIDFIRKKSSVLPLGVNLTKFDKHKAEKIPGQPPLILWNHRWDEDKNPTEFFDALEEFMADNLSFRVAILGEKTRQNVEEFQAIKHRLGERVVQFGYVKGFVDYARLLWQADYVVSTAYQEFFGISVVEGVYCGCVPILPDRLNYPYLVPEKFHNVCLYPDGKLSALLRLHLQGELTLNQPDALRDHVMQWEWGNMLGQVETALLQVIQQGKSSKL